MWVKKLFKNLLVSYFPSFGEIMSQISSSDNEKWTFQLALQKASIFIVWGMQRSAVENVNEIFLFETFYVP